MNCLEIFFYREKETKFHTFHHANINEWILFST